MSLVSVPLCPDSSLRCNSSQASFLCSYGSKEWLQSSRRIIIPFKICQKKTGQEWEPVPCVVSARPTLDDVERLSRGCASKAKIGSRAVPHRLNTDERKAYELAKKRGFVVHQSNTRRYPLLNTHRNYCDALGIPCIRIDQGLAGRADEVVMDLTPLHMSEVDFQSFREQVVNAVESVLSRNDQASNPSVGKRLQQTSGAEDSLDPNKVKHDGLPELMDVDASTSTEEASGVSKPLGFEASSRSEAKLIAQTVVDTWKSWSARNLRVNV